MSCRWIQHVFSFSRIDEKSGRFCGATVGSEGLKLVCDRHDGLKLVCDRHDGLKARKLIYDFFEQNPEPYVYTHWRELNAKKRIEVNSKKLNLENTLSLREYIAWDLMSPQEVNEHEIVLRMVDPKGEIEFKNL